MDYQPPVEISARLNVPIQEAYDILAKLSKEYQGFVDATNTEIRLGESKLSNTVVD
jgi:hypothetical protein